MDLSECKRKGFIKRTKPNVELVKSLIEISKIKEESIKKVELNERNICAYIPMAYDSLREIMEGICIMNGYKVTSHICIERLLKEIYPNITFKEFDRFRYIRNSINYYGKKVELEQGKEIIKKIFILRNEMSNLLKKLIT